MARLKFHQHIDIAVRPEIVPEHGAEKGQLPNVVPAAEFGQFVFWNLDVCTHDLG
jgi:hypothetical protein